MSKTVTFFRSAIAGIKAFREEWGIVEDEPPSVKGCGLFLPSMKVWTSDGQKSVSDLKPGDQVISRYRRRVITDAELKEMRSLHLPEMIKVRFSLGFELICSTSQQICFDPEASDLEWHVAHDLKEQQVISGLQIERTELIEKKHLVVGLVVAAGNNVLIQPRPDIELLLAGCGGGNKTSRPPFNQEAAINRRERDSAAALCESSSEA